MILPFQKNYDYYKKIFDNVQKPFAYIDLNYLDENISSVLKRVNGKKNIRIATKSIRCAHLLNYILNKSENFCGLMSYDANETLYLLSHGFDNILLGYPIVDKHLIENIVLEIKKGKNVCFMVDTKNHVQILEEVAKKQNIQTNICLDVNLSQTYPFLYFGANRSSLNSQKSLSDICTVIKKCSHLKLQGIMGYEAQIAGVGDNTKGEFFQNSLIRLLKRISIQKISQLRKMHNDILKQHNFQLDFVNGGGSGSLESTILDTSVTEVTVGSAFYSPHFMDDFHKFKHFPAAGFAVEITRHPKKNIFTAHGGGYHASGPNRQNRTPKPYLPRGLHLLPNESAGEIQTPLLNKGKTSLEVGDPIFMRHAKAGEMCERFNKLHLVSNGKIIATTNTYRGDGLCTL